MPHVISRPSKLPTLCSAFVVCSTGTRVNIVAPKRATLERKPSDFQASIGSLQTPSVKPTLEANWFELARKSDMLLAILRPSGKGPLKAESKLGLLERINFVEIGARHKMTT